MRAQQIEVSFQLLLLLAGLFLLFHLSDLVGEVFPFLPVDLFLVTLAHTCRLRFQLLALFLIEDDLLLELLLGFELFLTFLETLLELLPLVLVAVGHCGQVDVVSSHEIAHGLTSDLFDPRKPEKEERVGDVADAQRVECKDELQLMLLVVANEAHEGVL